MKEGRVGEQGEEGRPERAGPGPGRSGWAEGVRDWEGEVRERGQGDRAGMGSLASCTGGTGSEMPEKAGRRWKREKKP